jgi:multiple sugar transport system ATP-binding protein
VSEVQIDRVSKVYPNGTEAVSELSLTVGEGELMVLVGPSGCGKTTALRMVAGLESVSSGQIRVGGRVINDLPPRERDVAMVFQNYALYPHMTVADNIGFSLGLRKLPKDQIRAQVEEAARGLGIAELLDRKPSQLSGGQRQRVAMGRAIVRDPSVFLMDEPLSNLDAKLRVQMRAEVSRVQRRLGVATLYVTHDQTEAMTLGDRVAVLRSGHLQQCDPPQALYDHPANMFVATFIGSPAMNLYETTLAAVGDGLEMRLGSQTVRLPPALTQRLPRLAEHRDEPLIVGIRPEHLLLAADRSAEAPPGPPLDADVQLVEALGNELFVHFTIDAPRAAERERVLSAGDSAAGDVPEDAGVARVAPRAPVRGGERTRFALDAAWLQFFDPSTGAAVGRPGESAATEDTATALRSDPPPTVTL